MLSSKETPKQINITGVYGISSHCKASQLDTVWEMLYSKKCNFTLIYKQWSMLFIEYSLWDNPENPVVYPIFLLSLRGKREKLKWYLNLYWCLSPLILLLHNCNILYSIFITVVYGHCSVSESIFAAFFLLCLWDYWDVKPHCCLVLNHKCCVSVVNL